RARRGAVARDFWAPGLAGVAGACARRGGGPVLPLRREPVHLDEEALARIARAEAPRLDRLDRAQHLLGLSEGHLRLFRDLLDLDLEVPEVVEVADDVLGDRLQPTRDEDAHVPAEVLPERLLRLGARDRVELLVVLVALREA